MKALGMLSVVLTAVGAVNWGLMGVAQFDLVAFLLGGQASPLSRVVYGLVGAAGVALLALWATGSLTVHSAPSHGELSMSRSAR